MGQFSRSRASMWTSRKTSESSPEKRIPETDHSVDGSATKTNSDPTEVEYTQKTISTPNSRRLWAFLLLAFYPIDVTGAEQNVVSPKLKRLRSALEPYSWAHLAKGTNKQPSMVDIGRMPGTNWCGKGWRADSPADLVGNLFFNVINIPCFVFSQ